MYVKIFVDGDDNMKKDKVSQFIQQLRKENDMTQQNLADKLFISDKTISKWERGISIPDIFMIEKLSEIFNISVLEFMNGERNSEAINNKGLVDEILIESVKEENNKVKHKNNIIKYLILIVVLFFILFLLIFLINNFNKVVAYTFAGSSKNFEFGSGSIIYSREKVLFNVSNFNFREKSNLDLENIKTLIISIYFDNELFVSNMYLPEFDKGVMNIQEWLEETRFNEYVDLQKNCTKNCMLDSLGSSNKNDFPKNFKIKVTYCTYDGNCEQENFLMWFDKIASNKLFG